MSYTKKALAAASVLLMGAPALADPSAATAPITLQGNCVKIGTNLIGTLGSNGNTPPGIQYDSTCTSTFNNAYDYLTPGSPFEGFSIKGLDGTTQLFYYYNNNAQYTSPQIPGALYNYSGLLYNGSTYDKRVVWRGSKTEFNIEHDVHFNNSWQYVDIITKIEALRNIPTLYFGRYTDPDARAAAGDSSSTLNTLGYNTISTKNVVFSEALASKYALGLYTAAASGSGAGVSRGWSQDPITYYNGQNDGNGDYTIGIAFKFEGLNTGDIVTAQYAYIFGPSAFAAGSNAVAAGAGGGTPGAYTVSNVGSASAPSAPPSTTPTTSAPTITGTSTTDSVSTSTSSSTRTETSYVTRSVTDTDSDGNPRTRSYTDTVVTTIPVTTTTTTTTPVTTTTYSDGSTTTSSGTSVVTTSSSDGTGSSAVTATTLDSTTITAPVTSTTTTTSNTTATRTVTRTVTSTDADGNPVVRTYTDTILDTTPVTTVTTTVTPTTTTTLADGSTSVTPGSGTSSSSSSNGSSSSTVTGTTLDNTAVTRTVTTSSSSSSATTGTRTVTRTVTDTDASGYPRTRTYTDTILDTTPVITTTTTSTPVTTTYNADGTTTVSEGGSSSSSSSTNGTTTSSVIATSLDSTAITRPSVSSSSVVSSTLPEIKVTLTQHKASENKGVQEIARHHTTTTTIPMVKTVVTTPVTTTDYADGTETVTDGTPVTTYELWNDVVVSNSYDSLFGRVDQLEALDNVNDGINGLLNHEPSSSSSQRLRVFDNNHFMQSYNADGYTADSKIFGGGFEFDVTKGWTVGFQYNQVNINLTGVDSKTHQSKDHYGIFSEIRGNTFTLDTNAAIANSKYSYSRTVENVFNNAGETTGSEWWVSNRLYWHLKKWLHPFIGYTVQNVRRNPYTETGSIQSARTVGEYNQTTHVVEGGVKLETRFGGKKHDLFGVSVEGSYATDNSYGVTAAVDYKELLFVEGSHDVNNGMTNNSITGRVKFRF